VSPARTGVRARKRFGQHFLEPAWQTRVIDACAVTADDLIVEIGPGTGALTVALAARARRVLAIEVDRDLAAGLEARALPALTVHTGDVLDDAATRALEAWLGPASATPFRVVGNLPYNVAAPILFQVGRWRSRRPGLRDATVMLQAEVADRLLARPATRDYGVLTILTALWAAPTRLLDLPPGAFRPAPKVRSTLVRLTCRTPEPPVARPGLVDQLVRVAFTQRRKTLANALGALARARGLDAATLLAAAGIDGRRRPETLHLVEFSALADAWQAAGAARPVL
jgi:16S rRNA (adenine1518-N6/adenine1519-N6)-dimethyltransferase